MSYQENYQSSERAKRYNEKYRAKLFKRWTTARELRVLDRALRLVSSPDATILDLPCGGGRLYPAIAAHGARIVGMDYAIGQVRHYRSSVPGSRVRFAVGSALRIPMKERAVRGVLCVRLMHHLPRKEDRANLVRELARVAERFVVVTYFDTHSLKNRIRRLTRIFHRKRDKNTMSRREIEQTAREAGFRLVAALPLSRCFSGHRYAVLERR